MAALMLGIDFSNIHMQIGLWNEEKTCAEIYQFTENGTEILPTIVIADEEGNLLAAKEALDYSMEHQKQGITSLYGNFSNKEVELENCRKTTNELFEFYLNEVLSSIRKRYGSASIARIGITGERMDDKRQEHLTQVMQNIGYSKEKLFFSTHADAVLWYEMYGGASTGTSMTLDFDSKGMIAYLVHPGEEGKYPKYVETIDYSSWMQGGLLNITDDEEQKERFTKITELALARKVISRLYVTGPVVENPEIKAALGNYISGGRRIFTGRALYCLGACYHAVKEKFPKMVIGDHQIFHNISMEAYQDAVTGPVQLLKAGTDLSEARIRVQVILDDTREILFRIEDARDGEIINCTLHPEEFGRRENKTLRLEIETRFLDYETLVLKIRDVGFGDIYPATYRVWEQLVNLT